MTVLASSAGSDEVDAVRRALDLDACLDVITTADDADHSKPAPDLVDAALTKAGLSASQALFIGDAVWDVVACADAGVVCIGLECGGTSAAELRVAGAVEVYVNPSDLLSKWDESAVARRIAQPS